MPAIIFVETIAGVRAAVIFGLFVLSETGAGGILHGALYTGRA